MQNKPIPTIKDTTQSMRKRKNEFDTLKLGLVKIFEQNKVIRKKKKVSATERVQQTVYWRSFVYMPSVTKSLDAGNRLVDDTCQSAHIGDFVWPDFKH